MRLRNRIFALLAFVLLAASGSAQTGSITGQVFDPQGAVIPNATVTATAETTGISHTVTTSSAGLYNFAALPPTVYTVEATAAGFQTEAHKNVVLNVAAILPVNFKFSLASASTMVEVQGANAATAETDSFQLSTVIESKQITDLPLILRDPYQLVLLSPGAVRSTNNIGGFSINGQRDRNNNFMLDGGDNNDTSVPGIPGGISSANPDSTQEFRVITNNFDAEYGRNTGAIVDVVTRSGSNKFHGDAYEFGRYNALGARDFFNTKANGPQDPYVRNDFGASVGGPLWKDRTFFFLNGEVQRFRTTRTSSTITPTAAFRTGQFTYIDPDPTIADGDPNKRIAVDLNTPGNPDNLSGLHPDPTIAKIFAVAPVGQADNGDGASTTYFFPSPDVLNDYNLTGRFDHKLSEKHQLTTRYIYGHSAETDPFHDESLPGFGNTSALVTNHNGVISLTSALSANSTNIFRAGYNQNNAGFFCNHDGFDSLLGVDSLGNGRDIAIPGFFNGSAFGCFRLGESNAQVRLSSTLFFSDTYSVVKGAHSFKFGGEFRSAKDNGFGNAGSRDLLALDVWGTISHENGSNADAYAFVNQNSASYPTFENLIWGAQGAVAGDSESQFFTGDGTRRASNLAHLRQHEWALFAQDTWRATPRLSLIGGIRYAFNGVPYEKDGLLSNFYGDASAPVPQNGFIFTPVGPGTGRQFYADSWKLIEPRLGFSYDVHGDGKTAIRGGYGIFHDRIFDNIFGNARSNPPFQTTSNEHPFDPDNPTAGPTVSREAFPGTFTPSAAIFDGAQNMSVVVIDPNLKIPTNQSYNLGIQHQLSGRFSIELNYVGGHTTHAIRQLDGAPPQPALVQALLASGVPAASLQTISLYTSFHAVNNTAFEHETFLTSIASGNYNALQAKVTGQIGTLTLTSTYTYAHALDNSSDPLVPGAGNTGPPRNSFDLGPEYGNSDTNVQHRGTVAANYGLPIGTGERYINRGLVAHVFEGIQISGIEQAQTGLPFDLRGTVDNLHTGLINRPQLVGNPYPSGRGTIVAQGVITGPSASAFVNPPFGQSVSIHRNKFTGPGYVNTDVVFQKTQTLREQMKLVFRAESYNVFNHPNFVTPGLGDPTTLGSPTFGISTAEVGQNDSTTGARQIQGAIKVIF